MTFATCPECKREMIPITKYPRGFMNPHVGPLRMVWIMEPHNTRADVLGGEACKGSNTEVKPS